MVKKAGVFEILLLLMGIGIVSFYFTTKITNHMPLEMVAFNYLTDEERV